MNHVITNNTWEFGGLLSGLPTAVAWSVIGLLALLGLAIAWWSYRRAVRPLTLRQRAVLVALRTIFLVTLLVCLTNPVQVERTTLEQIAEKPRLAVVVDRSDSMTTEDNRGRSRLSEALRTWRRLEPGAHDAFSETSYYSLAKDLRPATTMEAAASRTGDTDETWLYQNLTQLLDAPAKDRPDSILVLTDGLDTSQERSDRLVTRALTEHVSLNFISGSNRLTPQPYVRVRELRAPATVLRNTEFSLDGTVEAYSNEAKTIPYVLWRGTEQIAAGNFTLTAGHNLLPWQTRVRANEPGEMEFILRLSSAADAPPAAHASTQVVGHEKIRVLFYQGALDWGFRYLIDALQTDSSFELTTLINPALRVTLAHSSDLGLTQLPDTVDGLKGFDFVILAHLYPAQLSNEQQKALLDFTRQGGIVLFTSPDATAVPQFADQPLAELLPVEFTTSSANLAAQTLNDRLRQIQQMNINANANASRTAAQLTPFSVTPAGLALPIFAQADAKTPLTPRFSEYVPVSRTKPGTQVLAVHPSERDPNSQTPYILLATQLYGRGRTAILTTDGLWHWKLNEPSASHVVETFWQQLLLWLGQGRNHGPRFTDAPAQVAVGDQIPLHIDGVPANHPPIVTAIAPNGTSKALTVQPTGDPETPWSCTWTATDPGSWELRATGGDESTARAYLFAIELPRGELAQTPPALDQMRALADATRGVFFDEASSSTWQKPEPVPPTVMNEQRVLLWDDWRVLALAFGAFTLELCLRRRWRLL